MRPALASVLHLAGGRRYQYVFLVGASVVSAVLEACGVAAIPVFAGALIAPEVLRGWLQSHLPGVGSFVGGEPSSLLTDIGLALIALFATKTFAQALLARFQTRFIADRQVELSSRLFRTLLCRPYEFHLATDSARLQRIVAMDAFSVFSGTVMPATQLVTECLVMLMVIAMLAWTSIPSTLLSLALLLSAGLIYYRFARLRVDTVGRGQYEAGIEMQRRTVQAFKGIKEVALYGSESFFVDAYRIHAQAYAHNAAALTMLGIAPRLAMEFIIVASMSGTLLFLSLRTAPMVEFVPALALFGYAGLRLLPSTSRLLSGISTIRFNQPGVRAVMRALEESGQMGESAATPASGAGPASAGMHVSVRAESLGFRYPGSLTWALHEVSFEAGRGVMLGIVGASGAGKSTLVNLILGLHRPTEGRILVDGCDLSGKADRWRRSVGFVPQDVFVLDDTIRGNVAFGIETGRIDDAKIWACLRKANLEAFVNSLPRGLDTPLGENGSRISGGQRQRVGIARALYRSPAVLILDEATSALDDGNAEEIGATLAALAGELTIIVVAHRAATIKRCGLVLHLCEGRQMGFGASGQISASNAELLGILARDG